jgi:predicted peptidase
MSWHPEVFKTLPWRVRLPEGYAPQQHRYPLVLFLHGSAERGADNHAQLRNGVGAFSQHQFRARFPCIVVAPQAPAGGSFGGQWYPGQHETQDVVFELLRELLTRRSVDPTRVYLTGLSMGAIGGWEMLAREPSLFAAAALVCGEPNPDWADAIRTPIWAFHGMRDDVVPPGPAQKLCAALRAKGHEARFTPYDDLAHESWDRAFHDPQLPEWLWQHSARR